MNLNLDAIFAPPELETERLLIKPVKEAYREMIFEYLSDHEVRHGMKMPTHDTPEKQEAWWQKFKIWREEGSALQWVAFLKDSGKYVSLLTIKEIEHNNLRGEVGYSVAKDEWGKGIGSEGVKCIVEYGFSNVNLHTIRAMILPSNLASQGIVKRLGFIQEAHFKECHRYKGGFYDLLQFYRINPEH
tara:strand:- start:224 stop:784 length:561 start_codon:yes stop_codon:yes gene_type:complete